jgi:hypothetical protein
MSDYWFARRVPVGHRRNTLAPVSGEGWMVVLVFVAAMAVGGIAFIALALSGLFLPGLGIFVLLATLGGAAFIIFAVRKGDRNRTVSEYRSLTGGRT